MDRPPEWSNDPGDYEVVELEPAYIVEVPGETAGHAGVPLWVLAGLVVAVLLIRHVRHRAAR